MNEINTDGIQCGDHGVDYDREADYPMMTTPTRAPATTMMGKDLHISSKPRERATETAKTATARTQHWRPQKTKTSDAATTTEV
jgi:hypothetical protein